METPSLPDEDALDLPAAWRRALHPRRGGVAVPVPGVDPAAVGEVHALLDQNAVALERSIGLPISDPEVAERVRAYLGGEADPLGAAGAALVATQVAGTWVGKPFERLTDAWITEHGLPFALRALVEGSGLATRWNSWALAPEGRSFGLGRVGRGFDMSGWWRLWSAARRLRALLTVADATEYGEAQALLEGMRDTPLRRIVVSYLLPEREDWLEECLTELAHSPCEPRHWWAVWCSVGTPDQLARVSALTDLDVYDMRSDLLATLVAGAGTGIVPLLVATLDDRYASAADRKLLLNTLAMLPGDEAFQSLVDRIEHKHVPPILAKAAKRYPVRALRLLAAAAPGNGRRAALATGMLRDRVLEAPEIAAAALPGLPEAARETIEKLSRTLRRLPEAPPESLPPLLVSPPWTRKRRAAEATVLTGLVPPTGPELVWADGEREGWERSHGVRATRRSSVDWAEKAARISAGREDPHATTGLLLHAPEDVVRPLLAEWTPSRLWFADRWLPVAVLRFGPDALPFVIRVAQSKPTICGVVLLPFRSVETARVMADWLARLRTMRPVVLDWLSRHGMEAARLLVPDALGKPGPLRRNAEGALLALAEESGPEAVLSAARQYGDEAAAAIEALLASDPLDRLPARVPKPGAWADPALLPQLPLRGRENALPADATAHVLTMLAMSSEQEYPGLETVREICAPGALAAFGRAVFDRWRVTGAPSKDAWALLQLGVTGDDETVRQLTPVIRAWPGEGGHKHAATGLDVLAAIGTDVALMHLYGIAQRVKFKALRTRAQEKIEAVAEKLGLSTEQLADRLVPDFGLDPDGTLTLDYGPRRFTVGFDEQLKPLVRDEDGKLRKALPKPGTKDDEPRATDAYKRFAGLKKDVRTVAGDQIHRLERAMVTRRRWTAEEFPRLFVAHPLIGHLVRRLVWLADDTTGFRVAEDRTLADVDDDPFTLPENARIGVAHPLDLGDDLKAWAEVFADYEIIQPFAQLGRPVHALTDAERDAWTLDRFTGVTVPTGKVLGMESRGWERGQAWDGGVQGEIFRRLPGGRHLVVRLDPGLFLGAMDDAPDQRLHEVLLGSSPDPHHQTATDPGLRLGDLDPVTASEVLADLTMLASTS